MSVEPVCNAKKYIDSFQLDSAVLDQEILHLLESQLKAVFKYLQVNVFKLSNFYSDGNKSKA